MLGVVSRIYVGLLRIVIASAIIAGAREMDINGVAKSSRNILIRGLEQIPKLTH
jgi:hypothetical protein